METSLAIISILFLVAAIALGFFRNINTGLIGIALAMICGVYICGGKAKDIIGYWPTSLIMTIMGITFLFSIAKSNGTLNVVADALTRLARGKAKLLPFFFFLLPGVLGFAGVTGPVVLAIVAPIVMAIGRENKIPNLDVTICAVYGCLAGSLNSVNASGAIASSLGAEAWTAAGMAGDFNYNKVFFGVAIIFTCEFLIAYFVRGMYKFKDCEAKSGKVTFTKEQTITLAVVVVALFSILVLKTDTGLTSFLAGTFLLVIGIGNQKDAIAGISWSTVLLVGGMTMLIKVVGAAGGIDLMSNALSAVMTGNTASSILAVIAALMSCVSSASGVVMPTLIPAIPGFLESVSGATFYALLIGIVFGAHTVTHSPMSTLGALCLAASDEDNKAKLFTQQLIVAIISTIGTAIILFVCCLLGVF